MVVLPVAGNPPIEMSTGGTPIGKAVVFIPQHYELLGLRADI